MVQAQEQVGASFNPEDFGQGGLFDMLLTVKSGLFQLNTFTPDNGVHAGQEVKNLEAKVTYTKEDGTDADWTYSVGPAESWKPSDDGLAAVPINSDGTDREGGKISPSSAFGTYLTQLFQHGFPANRLASGRLDALYGTSFKSTGVIRKGAEEGSKQILVAGESVVLADEVVGATVSKTPPTPSKPATPKAPPKASNNGAGTGMEDALATALKMGDSFTLPLVMAQTMADYSIEGEDPSTPNPRRDAAATAALQLGDMLTAAGYTVDGYNVSK